MKSSKSITAIEWLESLYYPNYIPKEIFDKAKEMEKKQIIEAITFGQNNHTVSINGDSETAVKYYNETFKK